MSSAVEFRDLLRLIATRIRACGDTGNEPYERSAEESAIESVEIPVNEVAAALENELKHEKARYP